MGLYQLIYQSQALIPFETPDLVALLHKSRARNHAAGITGILLHAPNGQFLQVLEGEQAAVQDLFHNRIKVDPRHLNCDVFGEGPCQQRTFTSWSMGFRTVQDFDMRTLLTYVAPDNAGLALLIPRAHTRLELLELLLTFMTSSETDPFAEPSSGS